MILTLGKHCVNPSHGGLLADKSACVCVLVCVCVCGCVSFYNQTPYAGLENHIANSYANSLVQVMHYTPLLRNLALQHAASACLSDPCLLCELGYVFDMLQKASVSTCQATNLLKTLSKYPQGQSASQPASHRPEPTGLTPMCAAGQLLLLDEEHAGQPCTAMNQGLLRFLFDKINNEYRTAVPASTALEQRILALPEPVNPNDLLARLFGIEAMNMVKCTTCRVETCRQGSSYAVDMMYPPQRSPPVRPKPTRVQFSQALKLSVEREQTNKGWCNSCQRYQSIKSRKTIHSIPAVLAVNTAINSQDHMHYWTTPNWLPEEIGIIVDHGQFFCYEGEDLQLHLQRGMHNISVYSLVGLVVNIESVPPDKAHLVAMVNGEPSRPDSVLLARLTRLSVYNSLTLGAFTARRKSLAPLQ